MAGVNDLPAKWRGEVQAIERVSGELPNARYGKGTRLGCAEDVRHVARTAWKPASEPPTESDADACGMVVVAGVNGRVTVEKWQAVHPYLLNEAACKWAKVRDVVLMPPEGEGE